MKAIDWLIIALLALIVFTVMTMNDRDKNKNTEREMILQSQACWDKGFRAVYVHETGEYVIKCER